MASNSNKKRGVYIKPSIVDEAYKIHISKRINEFRDSDEQILVFPTGLDNQERKYVHELCLKLGLISKSSGKGDDRFLTVKKPDSGEMKDTDQIPILKLHPACLQELNAYFQRFPIVNTESEFVYGRGPQSVLDSSKSKSKRSNVEEQQKVTTTTLSKSCVVPQVIPSRSKLPIWKHRQEIIQCIDDSDVTIISGETGSGKSTQVVQYILDHVIGSKIICTQPRRLSAIALAERVAEERAEAVGKEVGYSVRFDTNLSQDTRLTFCTTGVALSALRNGLFSQSGLLQGMTHLFIDEVHERDRNTDFLLIFVRELLQAQNSSIWAVRNGDKIPKIKIILMSATMSVAAFLKYFSLSGIGKCSTVSVEGSSFVVHPLFLEDVISLTKDYVKSTLNVTIQSPASAMAEAGERDLSFILDQQRQSKKLRCPLCGMGFKQAEEFGAHAATCQGSLGVASGKKSSVVRGSPSTMGKEEELEDVWGLPLTGEEEVSTSRISNVNESILEDVWGSSSESEAETTDEIFKTQPVGGVHLDLQTRKWKAVVLLDEAEAQPILVGDGFDSKELAEEAYLKALERYSISQQRVNDEREEHLAELHEHTMMESDPEVHFLLDKYLQSREGDEEYEADVQLIIALLEKIDSIKDPTQFYRSSKMEEQQKHEPYFDDGANAILIFLSGWSEISALCDALSQHFKFGNEQYYQVLPLHSGIPSKDQRKVFSRPRSGVRKIICATNIAETSITIEDVVFVIDTGLVKEKGYDSFTKSSSLLPHYISKANARQRRGRAGRCRPGICFHLFSKQRFDNGMLDSQLPELVRTPLEEMCLHAKAIISSCEDVFLQVGRTEKMSIAGFLTRALDPPILKSIQSAILNLISLGAMDIQENLTRLGEILSFLPIEPRLGRMLLMSSFFSLNCSEAVTLSVTSGFRDPFVLTTNNMFKQKSLAIRQRLSHSNEMGLSDHIGILHCFREFISVKSAQGEGEARKYCQDNFLSFSVLDSLIAMRKQISEQIMISSMTRNLFQKQNLDHLSNNQVRAASATIVKATAGNVGSQKSISLQSLITLGTYPNLAILHPNGKWTCAGHKRIRTHPTSVVVPIRSGAGGINNTRRGRGGAEDEEAKFYVFEELIRGSKGSSTVRVVSKVDPLVICLFFGTMNLFGRPIIGNNFQSLGDEGDSSFRLQSIGTNDLCEIKLNDWARIRCEPKSAEQLAVLRLRLELTFMRGIEKGSFSEQDRHLSQIVMGIVQSQNTGVAKVNYTTPHHASTPTKPVAVAVAATTGGRSEHGPTSQTRSRTRVNQPLTGTTTPGTSRPIHKAQEQQTQEKVAKPGPNSVVKKPSNTPQRQQQQKVKPFCIHCNQPGHLWYGGCEQFNGLDPAQKEYFKKLYKTTPTKTAAPHGEQSHQKQLQ